MAILSYSFNFIVLTRMSMFKQKKYTPILLKNILLLYLPTSDTLQNTPITRNPP